MHILQDYNDPPNHLKALKNLPTKENQKRPGKADQSGLFPYQSLDLKFIEYLWGTQKQKKTNFNYSTTKVL